MVQHDFTASEFELLKYWSGWAHTLKPRTTTTAAANDSESGHHMKDKDSAEHHETDHQPIDSRSNNTADEGHNFDDADAFDTTHPDPASTSSPPLPSASVPRPDGITPAEMAHVGWMIKRIFDHGRVHYLQSYMGFTGAKQVVYCDPSLSPENCLLVATRQG